MVSRLVTVKNFIKPCSCQHWQSHAAWHDFWRELWHVHSRLLLEWWTSLPLHFQNRPSCWFHSVLSRIRNKVLFLNPSCESLGSGKQLIRHGNPSAIAKKNSSHMAVLRRHFLPNMYFQCYLLLQGTLGGNFDICAASDESLAWVLLWKTRSRPIGARDGPVAQYNFSPPSNFHFNDNLDVPFGPQGPPSPEPLVPPGSPGSPPGWPGAPSPSGDGERVRTGDTIGAKRKLS